MEFRGWRRFEEGKSGRGSQKLCKSQFVVLLGVLRRGLPCFYCCFDIKVGMDKFVCWGVRSAGMEK